MTREFIERYQGILADIAAIKADKVTDTVSASSSEFPYSQHMVAVQGVPLLGFVVASDVGTLLDVLERDCILVIGMAGRLLRLGTGD